MKNKLLVPLVAAGLAISSISTNAEDVQEKVSGVLCEVPVSCSLKGALDIRINPEIESSFGKSGKKSSLDINFQCESNTEGKLKQSFHTNIENVRPEIFNTQFIQGEGIAYQLFHFNDDVMDKLQCTTIHKLPYSK